MTTETIGTVCKRFSSGKGIAAKSIQPSGLYPVIGANGLRGYTGTFNFDGRCAVIGRQGAYCGNVRYFEGKAFMTEHAIVAEANENNDSGYLAYKLQEMNLVQYQGQSAQPGLSVNTLSSVRIEMPDLQTQVKVFNILHKLDDKISNNNVISSQLESLAKTIYDYWFLQFEFPNEDGKPYKSSGGKMVWNEELKREIPEGWEVKDATELFDWIGASQPPKSTFRYSPMKGYVRFVQNRDYESDDNITYIPLKDTTKLCDKYDIMIDKYGDKTAGAVRYGIDGAYNVALGKIDIHNPIMREYIRSFLSTKNMFLFLHNACIASTRASLNGNTFTGLKVIIPSTPILALYSKTNLNIIDSILHIKTENRQLTSLRDFLLPLLINGQVTFRDGAASEEE